MADPIPSDAALIQEDQSGSYNPGQFGVFAQHPLATPKYALGKPRDAEYKETLARMYIDLGSTDDRVKQQYLQSLPGDVQTQALAKVLVGAGQKVQTGFIDFFLGHVQESFVEKVQVDQVLGDNYVAFYFGQEPPVFTFTGNLLNSQQDDQRIGFAIAYQNLLRGTSLGRRGALLRVRYDSVIVSGTGGALTEDLDAANELIVPFSFSLLVKEYIVVQQPRYRKTTIADFVQLATAFASPGLLGNVGQASDARVRTTMILPPVLAQASAAGSEENITVVDTSQQAPQQLAAKAAQITAPPAPTTNILGTITKAPSAPPAPNAPGL
jgi:hypothetical protein